MSVRVRLLLKFCDYNFLRMLHIPTHSRYPAYLIFLPHITLIISGEECSEEKVQLAVVKGNRGQKMQNNKEEYLDL
jgi:hypothetical protein